MKKIIIYLLLFFVVSVAHANEYQSVVIKLKEIDASTMKVAKNINVLESIAVGLNSNISNLVQIAVAPTTENNSLLPSINELNRYRTILLDDSLTQDEILQAVKQIGLLDDVEEVYVQPKPLPATVDMSEVPTNNTVSPSGVNSLGNFIPYQGYLNPAPQGIDAKHAWTVSGGDAKGIKIVDVEAAWNRTHDDLPNMFTAIGGDFSNTDWFKHGTAVAGVVSGVDNGFGIKGIAFESKLGTSNIYSWGGVTNAIIQAADAVGDGGVIIIEVHYPSDIKTANCTCNESQCNFLPVEYFTAQFDAIKYAVAKGVTVIEAAGNGSVNFDNAAYNNRFNRAYRDSGAILVAASNSTARTPACFTNYGNRIDVHGWGWNVTTTGYGDLYSAGGENQYYTSSFSGTSSAAPIVAGAAASLQGIAKKKIGRFLTPHEIRNILSSTATPQSGDFGKRIAGLPNLKKAIVNLPSKTTINLVWMIPAIYYPMLLTN
jgi:hypothetical protein